MPVIFVDTNVFVYVRDATEPDKQSAAAEWLKYLWASRCGRLSSQVLQEFYLAVTEKLDPGLSKSEARDDVRALSVWKPIVTNERVMESAWWVQDRFKYSWWDCLIIAAAQIGGCTHLLSEDLHAEQEVGGVRIVNPFLHSPTDLAV